MDRESVSMHKIGDPEFSYDAPCVAREYERWKVCIDMNFTFCKGKGNKKMVGYIYGWIGKKDRVYFEGLIWGE